MSVQVGRARWYWVTRGYNWFCYFQFVAANYTTQQPAISLRFWHFHRKANPRVPVGRASRWNRNELFSGRMPIRSSQSSCSAWGEGGTMRDLVGWYLGWYRAARAWRLHRGLIPAPKGLCGHKEAINLACNPSGGWNPPRPTFRGPDKSSVHPCLLHAHWPGSTRLNYKWDSLSFQPSSSAENWARARARHVIVPSPALWNFNTFTLFDRASYSV